jgi:uncharacterized protein (TIGR03032 family)
VEQSLLETRATRDWWSTLARLNATLLITREYEHLAMALSACEGGRPKITFFPVPHPSGLAVDRATGGVFLASTRNPNQVYEFRPTAGSLPRSDRVAQGRPDRVLAPASSVFYPGCLYLHDLALVGDRLHANAVGLNVVARLKRDGRFEKAWWPKCVEHRGQPDTSRNFIQLNSIAAGKCLADSYFTASSAAMSRRRPGHLNYAVDRRGVILSGRTREPVCEGLTRPHSARLRQGRVWVANSGYGELGFAEGGKLETVSRLPGWTRGLCLVKDVAFVATSRVIPRFSAYAPGLDAGKTRCAVHAVCCKTGLTLGSLEFPNGNQIFAVDWIPAGAAGGFPFETRRRSQKREEVFFYTYLTAPSTGEV